MFTVFYKYHCADLISVYCLWLCLCSFGWYLFIVSDKIYGSLPEKGRVAYLWQRCISGTELSIEGKVLF